MPDGPAVKGGLPPMLYLYDGSFSGLLCCVYESFTCRQTVIGIVPTWEAQSTLYPAREVVTDEAHASRVYASLEKKLGPAGRDLVTTGFLSGGEEKAFDLYRFIVRGYRTGHSFPYMLGDELVSRIHDMDRGVRHEAHLFTGFVRFSQYDGQELDALPGPEGSGPHDLAVNAGAAPGGYRPHGVLAAVIEPKNNVLPLMSPHFCGRYPEERFLIFDKTNRQALVYQPYKATLVSMENFTLPPAEKEEALCRRLWKGYYDTIAIPERNNPTCRRSHMPKRYWPNMTEFQ